MFTLINDLCLLQSLRNNTKSRFDWNIPSRIERRFRLFSCQIWSRAKFGNKISFVGTFNGNLFIVTLSEHLGCLLISLTRVKSTWMVVEDWKALRWSSEWFYSKLSLFLGSFSYIEIVKRVGGEEFIGSYCYEKRLWIETFAWRGKLPEVNFLRFEWKQWKLEMTRGYCRRIVLLFLWFCYRSLKHNNGDIELVLLLALRKERIVCQWHLHFGEWRRRGRPID